MVVVASNNKHKIVEIEAILKSIVGDSLGEIKSLRDVGYTKEIIEDGTTFEENARIKAKTISDELGVIAIADDSGLCVDYLNGEPGVYSARYAGEPCNDTNNNEKLLIKLKGLPKEERNAKFVSVISMVFPDGREVMARGECPGIILEDYRGNDGFGYDPLFLYEPMNKTFAELCGEEKNKISHRARAMKLFGEKLKEVLNGEKI